ncbi:MAG: hypothetical protein CFE49_02720 [Pseudomonas sp. PGPPP3]|nr:MAG: hypothetical protein CFE49_02720 [Pseudomonas sp. PGPPP3]
MPKRQTAKLLANATLFQLGWFACAFSPQHPWLLLVPLLVLGLHIGWLSSWAAEGKLLLGSLLIGVTLDSALLHLGVFDFGQPLRVFYQVWTQPLWLALLWPLLASTLRHSLAWTAQPWWRASLLGATSAPLSYYAGAQLAGVALPYGTATTLLVLALIWAVVLPLLHRLARSG